MNQAFSKIWIIIIILALAGGGIFAWQYFDVPKEEIRAPQEEVAVSEEEVPAERVRELEREPEEKIEGFDNIIDIIVTSPTPNQIITNPVRVFGKSNTFEATVRIRIKDDNNKVLANTFGTMGGTLGTLEPFTKDVFYIKPSAPRGVIEVFETSPKDGTEINKVSIPIIFGPYEEKVVNIRVISPDRGERWEVGKYYKIRWEAVGTERVTVFLTLPQEEAKRENCKEFVRIASHTRAAWGELGITVFTNICPNDRYKIKICDWELYVVGAEVCDESDNYFSIVRPDL